MALFESTTAVPLKTERGNRVFPVSDRSHDVANALERAYAHAGGRVVHAAATDILTQDGAVSAVVTTEGTIDCDAAVICTGGLSYPLTGSTGDGYRFAAAARAIRSRPRAPRSSRWNREGSLTAPRCRASPCKQRDAHGSTMSRDKAVYSGPGRDALHALRRVRARWCSRRARICATVRAQTATAVRIDLKPALDEKNARRAHPARLFRNTRRTATLRTASLTLAAALDDPGASSRAVRHPGGHAEGQRPSRKRAAP